MKTKPEKLKTRLEKYNVCEDCHCVRIVYPDCRCSYDKYKTINLEFEVCVCCGNLIEDGKPADTLYNRKQLEKHGQENDA
jgi:hypothetical protein